MATYYFNNKGEPATPFTVSGEELVSKGQGIKAIAPDGIEAWRLSYDTAAKAVVVYAEGQDEAGAIAQKETDGAAQAVKDKEKQDADTAASEA